MDILGMLLLFAEEPQKATDYDPDYASTSEDWEWTCESVFMMI